MGAASRRTSGGCSGYAAIDSINPVPSVLAAFLALAATTVAAANDGLASMRAAGVMRWGCDISGGAPFAFPDPSDPDRVIGFEVEIAEDLARRLGVRAERYSADWLALIDGLEAQRCDLLINGFEVTADRARVVAFSSPYFRYAQQLVVRAEDRDRFTSLAALAGSPIAVLNGSASIESLRTAGVPRSLIVEYDDSLAPFTETLLGRVDACLQESFIARFFAGHDERLALVEQTFDPGEYGVVVRKSDGKLLAEVNAALSAMRADGTLGRILQRWGLWNDAQRELGTERGPEVAAIPEAIGTPPTDGLPWSLILWSLARAAAMTALLTVVSMPIATFAGLWLAIAILHGPKPLSRLCHGYVLVTRGTPLLVQIFLLYYSLPALGTWLGVPELLTWNKVVVGIVCLAANYAAYEAEIHRAALQAIPRSQWDAAGTLGFTPRQTLRFIVIPQSWRLSLPAIINDLNSLIKDSSLVSMIGVQELLAVALGIGKASFAVPSMLVAAAAFYLVLSLLADWFGHSLERRARAVQALPEPIPR
jgi:polar amino acid transport system substrate-binding protein